MLCSALAVLALLSAPFQEEAPKAAAEISVPVGVPHWLREIVFSGSRLKAAPTSLETPLILRIDSVSPHGKAFRYDLEFYGLDPGAYDLANFVQREDGSSSADLAPLFVTITSALPAGQVRPNPVQSGPLPSVGGYRLFLWGAAGAWLLGALLLWLSGRAGTKAAAGAVELAPATLAERLAPLVEEARLGTLSRADRAELELMLIAFWRTRLGLEKTPAAQALERLKDHADAGPLLRQLELWLHSPGAGSEVNLAELLAPYSKLGAAHSG
ncbi:MAG: hypothetical protein ABGY71_04530 [bacterium]|jgi:hypothetical protein|nr:hypothetical protein [Planctomycetota bacterium]HIL52747.1 hypothetical protein [Planctomycetota bacterium]